MIAVVKSQVTSVSYTHKDKDSNEQSVNLEKDTSSYIVLDATVPHNQLVVIVKYMDVNDSKEEISRPQGLRPKACFGAMAKMPRPPTTTSSFGDCYLSSSTRH